MLGGEDGKSAIKNKLYIHGKLVSFNTFRQPTVSRISTIQKTFGSKWTDEYRSMISFDNLFTWRCNLDRGSDGTWCKGLSKVEREAAGQSSILIDKAFGLIDMNFANLLFN